VTVNSPDRPAATGRRWRLTPHTHAKIVEAVRAGNHLQTAAAYAGVGYSTLFKWLAEARELPEGVQDSRRELLEAIESAQAENEKRVIAKVIEQIEGGYTLRKYRKVLPNGAVEEQEDIAPPDGRLGMIYLGRRHPQRWSQKAAVEISGPDGGPIAVASETQVQMIAARLAEWRGRVVAGELESGTGAESDEVEASG
jgi:hypothetical protein